MNFFRFPRNLRTFSLSSKRPGSPSIAYAYMGHWSAEQEPWRQCAGRSLHSICKELESHIPTLLTDLGLTSLPWENLKDGK
jgi:hypothetical protein